MTALGGHVHWAPTAEDARRIIGELCRSVGADRRQVEIDGGRGDRAQRASRGHRHRADRNRPRRIYHPAPARAAQSYHRAGGAPYQGSGRRHVSGASRQARLHQATDRAHRPGGRGALYPATEIPRCRRRPDWRQFPGCRDRLVDAGHQRRQRRSYPTPCRRCISCWPASRR